MARRILRLNLILCLTAAGIDAATITYRLDGFNPSPYATFGRSVIDPGSNNQVDPTDTRINSSRMDGGRFVATRTGGDWPGSFPSGDIFYSFCIEPRQFVSIGGVYTDELVPLELGTTNIGGMGSAKAERLRELFGRYLPDFTMPLTRLEAGALQIAVWEIVREDSGVLNVYSGDIYFYPGAAENPVGVVALAQSYVQSLDGTGRKLTNLYALISPTSQDLIVQLPEPGTLLLTAAGLLAVSRFGQPRRERRRPAL